MSTTGPNTKPKASTGAAKTQPGPVASEPQPIAPAAPESLWSVEEEGFALVSPRGEGRRTAVPRSHQPMLIELGKPDREVMEQLREQELAERRARRSTKPIDAPLLASVDPPPSPRPEIPPRPEVPSPRTATPQPTARLEYIDVATGVPAEPTEPGTLSTGRIVAEIDGETVEIDEEDLVGYGDHPDPRERRYRYDADSPAGYRGQAQAKKAARAARSKSAPKPTAKKRSRNTRAGLRKTFDSAPKAAGLFYEHNADFFDHVPDPWDGLRDWMDGVELRVGKGHQKLAKSRVGKRILGDKHAAGAIRQALAYLLGKAKGRRWDAVPWVQVDRLGEALERYYEAPTSGPGRPGLYWRPFTGTVRPEDLDAMTPAQREAIREQESAQEIGEQLEQLQEAYDRAKECLPRDLRTVVERRIAEWSRWVEDPKAIPEYACEPDPKTAGYLCNYPAVAGELAQLRRSCEDAYDPDWAAKDSKKGTPGFPDTSAGEDELPSKRTASAKACCLSAVTAGNKRTGGTTGTVRSKQRPDRAPAKTGQKKSVSKKTAAQNTNAGAKKTAAQRKEIAAKHKRAAAEGRRTAAEGKKSAAMRQKASPRKQVAAARKQSPAERKKATAARKQSPAERKKATAARKQAATERRKRTAAERRAKRLACSAAVAMRQATSIDIDSYRRRLAKADAELGKATQHLAHHEKELATTLRDAEVVVRDKDSRPYNRERARRRVRDARCQLRIAQGALRQRKRDRQRAHTELQRALARASRREAVAATRQKAADKAKAEALALVPTRRR